MIGIHLYMRCRIGCYTDNEAPNLKTAAVSDSISRLSKEEQMQIDRIITGNNTLPDEGCRVKNGGRGILRIVESGDWLFAIRCFKVIDRCDNSGAVTYTCTYVFKDDSEGKDRTWILENPSLLAEPGLFIGYNEIDPTKRITLTGNKLKAQMCMGAPCAQQPLPFSKGCLSEIMLKYYGKEGNRQPLLLLSPGITPSDWDNCGGSEKGEMLLLSLMTLLTVKGAGSFSGISYWNGIADDHAVNSLRIRILSYSSDTQDFIRNNYAVFSIIRLDAQEDASQQDSGSAFISAVLRDAERYISRPEICRNIENLLSGYSGSAIEADCEKLDMLTALCDPGTPPAKQLIELYRIFREHIGEYPGAESRFAELLGKIAESSDEVDSKIIQITTRRLLSDNRIGDDSLRRLKEIEFREIVSGDQRERLKRFRPEEQKQFLRALLRRFGPDDMESIRREIDNADSGADLEHYRRILAIASEQPDNSTEMKSSIYRGMLFAREKSNLNSNEDELDFYTGFLRVMPPRFNDDSEQIFTGLRNAILHGKGSEEQIKQIAVIMKARLDAAADEKAVSDIMRRLLPYEKMNGRESEGSRILKMPGYGKYFAALVKSAMAKLFSDSDPVPPEYNVWRLYEQTSAAGTPVIQFTDEDYSRMPKDGLTEGFIRFFCQYYQLRNRIAGISVSINDFKPDTFKEPLEQLNRNPLYAADCAAELLKLLAIPKNSSALINSAGSMMNGIRCSRNDISFPLAALVMLKTVKESNTAVEGEKTKLDDVVAGLGKTAMTADEMLDAACASGMTDVLCRSGIYKAKLVDGCIFDDSDTSKSAGSIDGVTERLRRHEEKLDSKGCAGLVEWDKLYSNSLTNLLKYRNDAFVQEVLLKTELSTVCELYRHNNVPIKIAKLAGFRHYIESEGHRQLGGVTVSMKEAAENIISHRGGDYKFLLREIDKKATYLKANAQRLKDMEESDRYYAVISIYSSGNNVSYDSIGELFSDIGVRINNYSSEAQKDYFVQKSVSVNLIKYIKAMLEKRGISIDRNRTDNIIKMLKDMNEYTLRRAADAHVTQEETNSIDWVGETAEIRALLEGLSKEEHGTEDLSFEQPFSEKKHFSLPKLPRSIISWGCTVVAFVALLFMIATDIVTAAAVWLGIITVMFFVCLILFLEKREDDDNEYGGEKYEEK